MAGWKSFIKEKGFQYDPENDYYKKSAGFGRVVIVDHIVKGLFKVTKGKKVLFNNFIGSFEEFKKIIEKSLGS